MKPGAPGNVLNSHMSKAASLESQLKFKAGIDRWELDHPAFTAKYLVQLLFQQIIYQSLTDEREEEPFSGGQLFHNCLAHFSGHFWRQDSA